MRSSSALKDRSGRSISKALMSASSSTMPVFKKPSFNVTLEPMPSVDSKSLRSDSSSIASSESSTLAASFYRNKDLLKLLPNSLMTGDSLQSDVFSVTNEPTSSEDDISQLGSAASICTPSRSFGRGKFHRDSSRSMPAESDLVRGLCNSAVRRTSSSVSDSLTGSKWFTRAQSIRFREKLLLSSSMAELPEEEVAPVATCDELLDEIGTPANDLEGSSRRSSLVWSTLRSRSRIFGSKKKTDGSNTPLSVSAIGEPTDDRSETPSAPRSLRRSTASSSSIHKRVSSALKKGLGFRGSNSALTSEKTSRTPLSIIKRSSTNSKDRNRSTTNFARRCSDVSSVLQQRVRVDQKKKDADEAKLYTEKVIVSEEPVLNILFRDGYDAVVVDVSPTGVPISDIANKIISGDSAVELHRIGMFSPYKNGILRTPEGKPDIIYIMIDKDDAPDKTVRIGVGTGIREAFESERLKKVLFYPLCIAHDVEMTDYLLHQFLLASYKAFTWSPNFKKYDCTITLAGDSEQTCGQMRRLYEELLNTVVKPKLAALGSLDQPPEQLEQQENNVEC